MSSIASGPPPTELLAYHGTTLLYVAIVFIPVEIAFVALRTYSRRLHDTKVGLDDILIWFALLVCLSLDALAIGTSEFSDPSRLG